MSHAAPQRKQARDFSVHLRENSEIKADIPMDLPRGGSAALTAFGPDGIIIVSERRQGTDA